jgi:hypothetical protein
MYCFNELTFARQQKISMTRTLLFVIGICVTSVLSSCKKSTGDNNSGQNSCTISVTTGVGKWRIEKAEYQQGSVFVDLTSSIELCQKDDYWDFLPNKTFSRVDFGVRCSSPIIENGTWDVISGALVVNGVSREVLSFDCLRLKVLTVEQGITYRYTWIKI